MTIPYLQRSLFESPKLQRSLLNLFNLARQPHFLAFECHKGRRVFERYKRAVLDKSEFIYHIFDETEKDICFIRWRITETKIANKKLLNH